jgi:uncharacterized membrane protein YeaQ/YmgE (transglycosylase-associated protein family)
MHVFFWFGLVGWVAGWVTGKTMNQSGHRHGSQWIDALIGLIGGLAAAYPAEILRTYSNWGLLVAMLCAAIGGTLLAWLARRAGDLLHRTA